MRQRIDSVLSQAKQEHWSEDPQWLRLVHYRPATWGGVESEADSDKFFLAKQGKINPELELQATIQAFFQNTQKIKSRDGKLEDPVGCLYFRLGVFGLKRKVVINFQQWSVNAFKDS